MSQSFTAAVIVQSTAPIQVERQGKILTLAEGEGVYASDIIKTQEASVELLFADGAKAILGPNSVMTVQEYSFSEGGASSFVLDLAVGAMRSISGKVVEENPDAFKVFTPRSTVGIRGTDFITKVNPDGSEVHLVISLDQGHNLVLTTHDGQQISLTAANQGAYIPAGADGLIEPHLFTQDEINALVQQIVGTLKDIESSELDEELKALLEANIEPAAGNESEGSEQGDGSAQQGETDQVTIPLDPSVLEYFGNDGTLGTSPGQGDSFQGSSGGTNSNGFGGGSDTVTLLGDDDDSGTSEPAPSTILSIDGNSSFYADGHTISSGTHVLASQQISITTDIADTVIISGDVHTISGGHVTSGHESIVGTPMSDGTVVGDVYNLSGGTLVAGNDTVTFANKTGGDSIYGDAHTVNVGATAHFGHDNINITQDFTNSTIAGDANTVDIRANLHWGNDTISVGGNVEAGANIYGDAVHYVDGSGAATTPEGGDDSISVDGTVSGTINAGGGADTVHVGSVSNGAHIDLGAGDNSSDILRIDTATNSTITVDNFDTSTDSLYIDGQKQDISGDGNYGGIIITFDNVSGNLIPTFTTPNGTTIGEDSSVTNIAMENVQDLNSDALTFTVKSQGQYGSITVFNASTGEFRYVLDGANLTVQGLNVGGSLQDSFEVTVSDGNGGTVTKTVNVTITGTNDAPTLSVSEADLNITEDATQTVVQGQATATDVDTAATSLSFSAAPDAGNPAGNYGTFAINAQTGLYTFTLAAGSDDVQALSEGQTVILTYTVSVSDGDASTSQQVTVTIKGTNDAPELTVSNMFINEGEVIVTEKVTVADIDTTDSYSYSVSATTNGYGTVTIDADGEYIFTLDNTLVSIQELVEGEIRTDTFTITVTDAFGGEDVKVVTVTITGTNDAPTLSVSEAGLNITEDATQTVVQGQATATDVDTDATSLSFSATPDAGNPVGNYGTFAIDAQTGLYTFTLAAGSDDVQELAAGSSVTLTYTVSVSDGDASTNQQVTVTINGTNDAPEIRIVANGNDVTVEESISNDSVSGSISVIDVDSDGATQTITINNTDIAGGATIEGIYGNLVVAADGTYTYTLGVTSAQIAAVEALGGVTPNSTDTFTVKTTDSQNVSDSEDLVFTVMGTDDAPMLDVSASSHLVSDGDLSEVLGSFTVGYTTEGDGSITMSYVNASGVSTTVEIFSTKANFSPTTVNTEYGTLTITAYDPVSGEFTYSYQQSAAVDHSGNAPIHESITLTVSDNDGNTADDATGSITITITDDAPTAQNDTNTVAKGTNVNGNVLTNDDAGADGWDSGGLVSVTPSDADWTAISATGFDFAFQNTAGDIIGFTSEGAYEFLASASTPAGATPSHIFTYTVSDADGSENSATLTVNVVDTLDAPPTITVTATDGSVIASGVGRESDGSIAADDNEVYAGDVSASGSLTVFDAEGVNLTPTIASYEINGASASQAQVDSYGSFTLTQDVSTTDAWDYAFTLNSNSVTALNEGDIVTITYRVEVSDGTTSTYENITVTITGTNDKPVLTLTATSNDTSLSEAIAGDFVRGSITVDDPDNDGGSQSISVNTQNVTGGGTVDGVYGQLVVAADGTYTYTLGVTAAQQDAVNKLTGHESAPPTEIFTVITTDVHGATDSKDLNFTITGENDAPTIISVEELQEWGGGSISTSDPDASDTEDFTFYVSEQGKDFGSDLGDAADFTNGLVVESGTLTLSNGTQVRVYDNGDGAGSYYVDVTYEDALAQDESRDESFTIYVQDEHGAWSSKDVTVTITGENDAPVISLSSTTAEVTAGSTLTASGTISVTDVDSDGAVNGVVLDAQQIRVVSQETGASNGESAYNAQGERFTVDGKYGQLLVLADGSYIYTLGVTQAQIDALAAIDPAAPAPTETFEITSTDKHGAEDSQNLTITVNPAPAQNPFLGLDTDTEVTKLSFDQSVSGTFAHDDDSMEITSSTGTKFVITNNASDVTTFDGTYGTLTVYGDGSYSYELYKFYESNAAALNALVSGSAEDTFTIVTRDGNTETGSEKLVITVNGAADGGPITFETSTDTVVKTGSLDDIRVEGRFEINSDSSFTLTYDANADNIADAGENSMQYALGENTLATEYGTLSITGSDGLFFYSFILDVNADATRALLAGEKKELHYILRTDNGDEQKLVITVVGEDIDSNVLKEQDGNLESGGSLIGDDDDATAFTSSWMTVTGDVTDSSIVVGDAHTYTGTGHMAQSGNDFIKVTDNALAGATIVGDVYADNSFSLSTPGRDKDLSVAASGNDSIMVEGTLAGAVIVGDSYVYSEFSDSEYDLRAEGGNDTISVGSMSSGFIYGDNRNDASDDGGEDSISVLGNMSGGEIHGQGGGNIISVGDTLSAGIINAGDGHDIVSVQNMTGGIIDGQGGDNSLNIANLSGTAKVHGGEGTDIFTIGKMTGGALYGGEGDDIFVISKDSFTGGTIDGGSSTYGYDKDIIYFTDTITQAFTPDGFGGSSITNIEGYTFEKITSTGSVSMTDKHLVNVHSLEGNLTMGGNANATVYVDSMSVGATVQTSDGDDEIRVDNMAGGTVYSDAGDDTLKIGSMTENAKIYAGDGNDSFDAAYVDVAQGSLYGEAGNDTFAVASNLLDQITIDGGDGVDTLEVSVHESHNVLDINMADFSKINHVEMYDFTFYTTGITLQGNDAGQNIAVRVAKDDSTNTIILGSGDDSLALKSYYENSHVTVEMTGGNDTIVLSSFDPGSSVTLKGFAYDTDDIDVLTVGATTYTENSTVTLLDGSKSTLGDAVDNNSTVNFDGLTVYFTS